MENLNIKYAIEFINSMGYNWDGKIVGKDLIPEIIYDFYCPQIVKLNGEEKGLKFYDDQDNSPECYIYWFEKDGNFTNFVMEKNLTKEWIDYLRLHNLYN